MPAIAEALKTDDELILATDPDREGEAISWHVKEVLAEMNRLGAQDALPLHRQLYEALRRAVLDGQSIQGPVARIFASPKDDYTKALLACRPSLEGNPALEEDWPTYTLNYTDENGAAQKMALPMTPLTTATDALAITFEAMRLPSGDQRGCCS